MAAAQWVPVTAFRDGCASQDLVSLLKRPSLRGTMRGTTLRSRTERGALVSTHRNPGLGRQEQRADA